MLQRLGFFLTFCNIKLYLDSKMPSEKIMNKVASVKKKNYTNMNPIGTTGKHELQ